MEALTDAMDLYSSLLRASVEEDLTAQDGDLDEAVTRVLRLRAVLGEALEAGVAADRTMATLEYDLALISLCRQLGLGHAFFQGLPPDAARRDTEDNLAERLLDLAHLRVHLDARDEPSPRIDPNTDRSSRGNRLDH